MPKRFSVDLLDTKRVSQLRFKEKLSPTYLKNGIYVHGYMHRIQSCEIPRWAHIQ